ncbi:hypothetical protein T484DRAFT_1933173, partial [Baffinella frigidus]
MGFEPEDAARALEDSGGRIEAAINSLLGNEGGAAFGASAGGDRADGGGGGRGGKRRRQGAGPAQGGSIVEMFKRAAEGGAEM